MRGMAITSYEREAVWIQGNRDAKRRIVVTLMGELGTNTTDPVVALAHAVEERQGAISKLRDLCAQFGDNDWPDELHLEDVIERHLARHLYEMNTDAAEVRK